MKFVIRFTNRGTATTDPRVGSSTVLVNGTNIVAKSVTWSLAFGNGAMGPRETALPPGETVEVRRDLGESLFTAPGDYTLEVVLGDRHAPPVTVHVTP